MWVIGKIVNNNVKIFLLSISKVYLLLPHQLIFMGSLALLLISYSRSKKSGVMMCLQRLG